jgi:outer membrane protein TolC
MRRLCILTLIGILAVGLGRAFPEEYYRKDAAVRDAERAVAAAMDALAKVTKDPDGIPLERTRREEALTLARARHRLARSEAEERAATYLTNVTTARDALVLATAHLAQATAELQAATVRHTAGAVSEQDLARAREAVATAQAREAQARRELASTLERLTAWELPAPAEVPDPPALTPEALTSADHPSHVSADLRVREAERAVALSQGPDSTVLERTAADRELVAAREALRETQRLLTQALADARRRYAGARESVELARQADRLSLKELGTARAREAAGSGSLLARLRAETSAGDARHRLALARADWWRARCALLVAAGGQKENGQ